MAFKIKDLMINVAPAAAAGKANPQIECIEFTICGLHTFCGYISYCGIYSYCGPFSACGYPTRYCTITYLPQVQQQEQMQMAAGVAQAPAVAAQGLMCPANSTICALNTTATVCVLNTTATICHGCSIHYSCLTGSCGFFSCRLTFETVCPGATVVGPTPTIVPDPTAAGNQLAALKAQLQEALADIEKQQKALEESLRPQTVADVEQLQEKMKEAMSELDKRKAELQKKPDKPAK
jgi:hypothetical protein